MSDEIINGNGSITRERLSTLRTDLTATIELIREKVNKLDEQSAVITELRVDVARLSERLSLFQAFQAGLSAVLATMAAIIGRTP
ncbi:hypothetical protein CCP3SC15_2560003 [Gammaproteobacteria bacterium]